MTEHETFRFMASLQSHKLLARAGVVVIDGPSTQMLRVPGATGPKLHAILYRLKAMNSCGFELSFRQDLLFQLAKVGVQISDAIPSGVIGNGYASFIGGSGPTGVVSGGDNQTMLFQAVNAMLEMNMSFNMQYLQLQSKMQEESRRFTLLSNVMKKKHDTAKNSISNVR